MMNFYYFSLRLFSRCPPFGEQFAGFDLLDVDPADFHPVVEALPSTAAVTDLQTVQLAFGRNVQLETWEYVQCFLL